LKHGVQIRGNCGDLVLEIGAHVLTSRPDHVFLVGEIAAHWAQAETHLGCYLASIIGGTPEDALIKLTTKKSGKLLPAADLIEKARELLASIPEKTEIDRALALI